MGQSCRYAPWRRGGERVECMREELFGERGISYRVSVLSPEKKTLLFVHGLSGSSSAWVEYERHFEKEYNVITLDLRGHGKSRKYLFHNSYSPELIVDDIFALLRHLSVARCVIIGHSFGTLLALFALHQNPQMFSAAIFLSPTFGASRAWWIPFARVLAATYGTLSLILPFSEKGRGRVDYSKLLPTGDWSLRRILRDLHNTTLRVYVFCMMHIYAYDRIDWWRRLEMPVLIVHGKDDSVIPAANAIILGREIPHATLVLMDDANHILPLNNFDAALSALRRFLGSLSK